MTLIVWYFMQNYIHMLILYEEMYILILNLMLHQKHLCY